MIVTPIALGNRLELLVDDALIGEIHNLKFRYHEPRRENVVWQYDKPWESSTSASFILFQDSGRIRMYYRATQVHACYAESSDGIHFEKPELQLYSFEGSKKNNIVLQGDRGNGFATHNFAPFLDRNPSAVASQRYKAVGGHREPGETGSQGLYAFASEDGLRWEKMQGEPVITKGNLDSLNVAFWDEFAECYRCYKRVWMGVDKDTPIGGVPVNNRFRGIQGTTSADFLHWEDPQRNRYPDRFPVEHFYSNAVSPAPNAPHILLSYPMRFMEGRKKLEEHSHEGLSDGVFLSSRDGLFWNRISADPFISPNRDPKNWTERSNKTAPGIIRTSKDEYSIYVTEHYRHSDNRLRRYSFPRDRYVALTTEEGGGEFTTRAVTFRGEQLSLNYQTSAAGSIQVEIQTEHGEPIPEFALDQAVELYGNELDSRVRWTGQPGVGALEGKAVRLRFVMKQARLYAFQFGNG